MPAERRIPSLTVIVLVSARRVNASFMGQSAANRWAQSSRLDHRLHPRNQTKRIALRVWVPRLPHDALPRCAEPRRTDQRVEVRILFLRGFLPTALDYAALLRGFGPPSCTPSAFVRALSLPPTLLRVHAVPLVAADARRRGARSRP